MGLRRLALSPYYRKYFDFYQMKNPPKDRLKQLGIKKLSRLVLFLADPILLAEPDSTPPIDKVTYELSFIFDNLKMFLDDMITEHGRFLQDVPQINNEADLEALKEKGRRFLLLFMVDKAKEVRNDQLIDRLNDMLILNKIASNKAAAGYIDVNCYPYLTELFRFREKDVPLLVIFDTQESSYIRSDFKLNIYDGKGLIEKAVLSNDYRQKFRPVKFQLGHNKCIDAEEKIDL